MKEILDNCFFFLLFLLFYSIGTLIPSDKKKEVLGSFLGQKRFMNLIFSDNDVAVTFGDLTALYPSSKLIIQVGLNRLIYKKKL